VVRGSSPVAETRVPADEGGTVETSADPRDENGHPPAAPRRRRRWLWRLVIGTLLLVLILAVAIQLALWSNLPKRLVLEQLQSQLGLRVQASSLTTGWLGRTDLRDVTLGLPMVEQSFLDMPHMQVKHTTLFGLLLRRPVSVDRIVLDNPTLYVRRDQTGRWNLQQVAELVARAAGKKPADESAQNARPKLPEVRLTDGTVVIQDFGKAENKIRPLRVHGRPDPTTPGILWRYDVEVPGHLSLTGQVVPGDPWPHEVDVTVNDVDAWLEPIVHGFPDDAHLAARWRGSKTSGGGVSGRLELKDAKAAGVGAKGVVLVSGEDGTVSLRPDGLAINTTQQGLSEAKVASGAIVYDGRAVRAERVYVAALGGQARLDGVFTLATHSGQLNAEWLDITTGAVRHSGSLDAKVGASFQNRPQVDATLVSRGVSPDGPWDAKFQLNGTSQGGWGDMDYTLNAPQLQWHGNYPLALDGLTAKLETRQDEKTRDRVIRLAKLTTPNNRVESVGEYDLATRNWKFWISLNALPIPGESGGTGPAVGVPTRKENAATRPSQGSTVAQARQNAASLAIVLNSWGDPRHLEIGQLLVKGAEFEMNTSGVYVYDRPSPLDINVKVKHIPPRVVERDKPPVYGYLSGEASVRGTVFQPRNLEIEGKLLGEGVTAYNRSIGDLNVKITGHADNDKAVLKSDQLELLKGRWSFDAQYARQDNAVTANLRVADLDLKEVGDLLVPFNPNDTRPVRRTKQDVDLLSGRVTADWRFDLPHADKDRIKVDGTVKARDVRAPGFVADAVDARTVLENGTLTIGPIHLARAITRTVDGAEKRLEGKADAAFSADLDDLTQVTASLNLASWPLEAGADGWIDISGGTQELVIDLSSDPDAKQKYLPGKSATGSIHFATSLALKGQTLGTTEIIGDFMGRMLDLRKFDIQTLDGNVTGNGIIELEKPLEARAFFSWENVNSKRLVELFPALRGLEGVYTGRLRVKPSVEPRALGPLAVGLELVPEGGRYNAIEIGKTTILAYADLNRFVLNDPADLASTMEIAGGQLKLWGRVSYHELQKTRDAISSQLLVDFKDLDLNQIVHAVHPKATDTPGRLDGSMTIIGATRGPRFRPLAPGEPPPEFVEKFATAFVAHGPVRLSGAKLGRLRVFSDLYDLMSLGQNVKQNNGVGSVEVRFENGNVELNNLRYFNRGTEVRAIFTIEQIWKGSKAPLYGSAIGSVRPLASLDLPFIAEIDRVIALLSADLASIGIDGTVEDPNPYQIGLRDLGGGLKTLLLGDVPQTKEQRKAPKRPTRR
jgi:hypothetical protein